MACFRQLTPWPILPPCSVLLKGDAGAATFPMTTAQGNEEKIHLRTGPSLVIWELLIRTLRNPEARKEVSPGKYEFLFRLDEAERQALHYLAGAIQRAVPEALDPVSPELIAEGKRWLLSRPK